MYKLYIEKASHPKFDTFNSVEKIWQTKLINKAHLYSINQYNQINNKIETPISVQVTLLLILNGNMNTCNVYYNCIDLLSNIC